MIESDIDPLFDYIKKVPDHIKKQVDQMNILSVNANVNAQHENQHKENVLNKQQKQQQQVPEHKKVEQEQINKTSSQKVLREEQQEQKMY